MSWVDRAQPQLWERQVSVSVPTEVWPVLCSGAFWGARAPGTSWIPEAGRRTGPLERVKF